MWPLMFRLFGVSWVVPRMVVELLAHYSGGARQFILGVPLNFFLCFKNFLHPKNLVIYTIYVSQKNIYKSS
jgi:hypothetical protein